MNIKLKCMKESIFVTLQKCTVFEGYTPEEIREALSMVSYRMVELAARETYVLAGMPCRYADIIVEGEMIARMSGLSGKQAQIERLGESMLIAPAYIFAHNNEMPVSVETSKKTPSSPISEINNAITYAHGKGCIVVFSSGNKGSAVSQPAAGAPSATLVVGAIDRNGYKSDFSGYGSSLDVVAPGREIWTTDVTGGYTCVLGTSFAAPHVSGIVALIWATDPDLSVWRVRNIIEQTTRKIGGNTYGVDPLRLNGLWNQFVGYGLVNAYAAVSAVSGPAPTAPNIGTSLSEVEPGDLSMMGLGYDKWNIAYLARGEGQATCSIENYDSSVTYVWSSTLPPYTGEGFTFTVDFASDTDEPVLHDIECRVLKNGLSTSSGVHLALIPQGYSY